RPRCPLGHNDRSIPSAFNPSQFQTVILDRLSIGTRQSRLTSREYKVPDHVFVTLRRTTMRLRFLSLLVLQTVLVLTPCSTQQSSPPAHWNNEGKEGPKSWGSLDPSFSTCKLGHQQSPIDIKQTEKANIPPIQFEYQSSPLKIIDNGHTVMVKYAPGSFITVGDHRYQLTQFHF